MSGALIKLLGGVLMVCCAVASGSQYRRTVRVRLERVRAWRSLLQQMRHELLQTGMELSVWLLHLAGDEALLDVLGISQMPSGIASVRWHSLCRAAAALFPSQEMAQPLLTLGKCLPGAVDAEQVSELLCAADAALAQLEQDTLQTLQTRCRAVMALCVCGALGAALILW